MPRSSARRSLTGTSTRTTFRRSRTWGVSSEAEAYREYGWDDLHAKSHGESFLWVINHRFRDRGLFILDEPEAALSPTRQLALLARMRQLVEAGSQFIISTHSPILLAYPDAKILVLDREGITPTNLAAFRTSPRRARLPQQHAAVDRSNLLGLRCRAMRVPSVP